MRTQAEFGRTGDGASRRAGEQARRRDDSCLLVSPSPPLPLSYLLTLLIVFPYLFLSGCAIIGALPKIERPQVNVTGARLTKLSLDQADLLFDIKIRNPNAVGIKFAGFDYDLLINNGSFLKGNKPSALEIPASGENTVSLPLELDFGDIYRTFQSLRSEGQSTYQLNATFTFNIPVLGVVQIPVSKGGDVPLIKRPSISVGSLRLRDLGITGAKLGLELKINNPNVFSMLLQHFQYQFEVDGQSWVSGDTAEAMQVRENGVSTVEIPISLNFLRVGQSVYQHIKNDRPFDYQFSGALDMATSVPLLEKVNLPFDTTGKIQILK